jgi:choline/glycine/proline betaine transport protein
MGMGRDQLIADVLVQFERYLAVAKPPKAQLVHGAPEHPTGA